MFPVDRMYQQSGVGRSERVHTVRSGWRAMNMWKSLASSQSVNIPNQKMTLRPFAPVRSTDEDITDADIAMYDVALLVRPFVS